MNTAIALIFLSSLSQASAQESELQWIDGIQSDDQKCAVGFRTDLAPHREREYTLEWRTPDGESRTLKIKPGMTVRSRSSNGRSLDSIQSHKTLFGETNVAGFRKHEVKFLGAYDRPVSFRIADYLYPPGYVADPYRRPNFEIIEHVSCLW